MSVWTHVAGVVRIDTIRCLNNVKPNFNKIFGKECLWDSKNSIWDDMNKKPSDYMPCGSEGSLRKIIWDNPNKNHASAYTVTIFGDLRDYEDTEYIVRWFKNCLKKCEEYNCWIRQATITVRTEGLESVTWTWKDKDVT